MIAFQRSEQNFRRFETVIITAIQRYPETTVVNPMEFGITASTATARVRDALLSWRTNGVHWNVGPDTASLWAKFIDNYLDIGVINSFGEVKIVSKRSWRLESRNLNEKMVRSSDAIPKIDFSVIPPEDASAVLNAAATLCHYRILTQGIILVSPPFDVEVLANKFDIGLTKKDDTYTMI